MTSASLQQRPKGLMALGTRRCAVAQQRSKAASLLAEAHRATFTSKLDELRAVDELLLRSLCAIVRRQRLASERSDSLRGLIV